MPATISAVTQIEAWIAVVMAVSWLVTIALLHVIKPEMQPSARMLSEYAIKPKGWIMQGAFFCIALSCIALAAAAWPYLAHVGLILLVIDGLAFVGAGVFVTDPVSRTRRVSTQSGILHNIFSLIVIPLFPVAATVVGISISKSDIWAWIHPWLPVLSVLTWVGFVGFLSCSAVYSALRRVAPVGYYQRFMVLTYAVWLIVVASAML